jgi:hypothetical protein
MSAASTAAQRKGRKPHLYCPTRGCLWMTGDGRSCPRHGGPAWTDRWQKLARLISMELLSVEEAHAAEEVS